MWLICLEVPSPRAIAPWTGMAYERPWTDMEYTRLTMDRHVIRKWFYVVSDNLRPPAITQGHWFGRVAQTKL